VTKPTVLQLVWALPFPPDQGGRIRAFHLLDALRTVADVSIACFGRDEPGEAAAAETLRDLGVPVTFVPVPAFAPHWSHHLRSPYPFTVQRYGATTLLDAARPLLRRALPDVLVVDGVSALVASVGVERVAGPQLVYQSHNVESEVYRRCLALGHERLTRRLAGELESLKMEWFERRRVRHFAAITAVSARDAATLQRWAPRASVHVIANGADCSRFAPLDVETEPGAVVFTGTLSYHPNRDAVCHFVEQIFPRIRAAVPTARLYVVGRDVDALPPSICNEPGIVCTGYVDDVRPYLARAEVVVVPLRAGGGTRLKILEAMAMGRPVVSTAVGAEGLELAGDEIVIADTPEAFAAAVVRVLTDPEHSQPMRDRARRTVLERYDWPAITRRYVDVMLDVHARGRRSRGRTAAMASGAGTGRPTC
jgi:sugar transferase (PEP-CTERM/EpsH1 system associated)